MKTVAQMLDDVIRREGSKFVDHPADKGGPTKFGITQATLSAWRGKPVTASGVRRLTEREARAIYEYEYYAKPGIDKLPPSIQPFVFDTAVNMGPARAIRFVQEVCKDVGFDPGPIDGIIGPRTLSAAHEYDRIFLDRLIKRRESAYAAIVEFDRSQRVFLAGWMNRLDEFRA